MPRAANVKAGLLDLFYGVYNRDSDRCLEALQTMGVYLPTGDKVAVRRTADFFLKAFGDRLEEQRKEREAKGAEYDSTFKPQRTKDEAKARRRQILTSIGEDLLLAANDQPFRFPATFTFVVRSFTVLDGIGKSLDARFDISEISAPYARELLLDSQPQVRRSPLMSVPLLRSQPAPDRPMLPSLPSRSPSHPVQAARFQKALTKGLQNQNRAVANLFRAPNQIEDVATTLLKLERGDIKLRVRALEAERALTRVQVRTRTKILGPSHSLLFARHGSPAALDLNRARAAHRGWRAGLAGRHRRGALRLDPRQRRHGAERQRHQHGRHGRLRGRRLLRAADPQGLPQGGAARAQGAAAGGRRLSAQGEAVGWRARKVSKSVLGQAQGEKTTCAAPSGGAAVALSRQLHLAAAAVRTRPFPAPVPP